MILDFTFIMICFVAFLGACAVTSYLVPRILVVSAKRRILDIPNGRKVHKQASSRMGGVSFFPSLFLGLAVAEIVSRQMDYKIFDDSTWFLGSFAAILLMYLVGFTDDVRTIHYRSKFKFQIIAALFVVGTGEWINHLHGLFGINEIGAWIGIPLTVLFVLFVMNAMNLIDGINGLSSGLAMVALSVYGCFFLFRGDSAPSLLAFASVGTLLGFFRYNVFGFRHKTKIRIFMGDTGTLFVGTVLSILAINLLHVDSLVVTVKEDQLVMVIAYSVLIVPCFDVVRVMLHRLKNGRGVFSPDMNHIHHKVIRMGLSTWHTLWFLLGLSFLFTALNVVLNQWISLDYILGVNAVLWTLLNIVITKRDKTGYREELDQLRVDKKKAARK